MTDELNLPEDKKPISFETIKKMFQEQGILKDGMTIKFDNVESFTVFKVTGSFIHALDYIDDPLFYDATTASLDIDIEEDVEEDIKEDNEVVTKKPVTLSGYLLYNKENEVIGFTCFNSQIDV